MGTILTYVCFGAFVLAMLFALAVVLFFVVAAVKKRTAAPPPPQALLRSVAPEPEPARYRQQERNFGDMALDWQDQVKREKERAAARANLEALFGVAEVLAKSPGVAAPKAE